MTKRVLVSVALFLAGFFLAERFFHENPPSLKYTYDWLRITDYRGCLNATEGEVEANVWALHRLSGKTTPTMMQNKIRLKVGDKVYEFMWPEDPDNPYVAGRCDIRDVSGDMRKEFLFYSGSNCVRIVSFVSNRFLFREKHDMLCSDVVKIGACNSRGNRGAESYSGIGPFDLQGNGKLVFLVGRYYDASDNGKIVIPYVFESSQEAGFSDRSKEYSSFYRRFVLPHLQEQQNQARDAKGKESIRAAILRIKTMLGMEE